MFGPCGGGGGKGSRQGPYGGGAPEAPSFLDFGATFGASGALTVEQNAGPAGFTAGSSVKILGVPEIVGLSIAPESGIAGQGYPREAPAMTYDKSNSLFGDAHHILQYFFPNADVKEAVQFTHDPECTNFPEVYAAWKAAGQEDNLPTVALCPSMGQWAVGFGGKKNAERAAKLAISLSVAAVTDEQKLRSICTQYPGFGKLCQSAGLNI